MTEHDPAERRANGLGIAGTICGAIAILFSIVPMCGMIPAILFAVTGIILAAVGFFAALSDKRTSIAFPIVGVALCCAAVIISIIMLLATAGTVAGISQAAQKAATQQAVTRPATSR